MSSTRRRGFAALVALFLLAASCGSDRDSADAPPDTTVPTDDTTATTAPEPEVEMFGDLESPCGPGDAAGATDRGVSDERIAIGYGDDAGFASAPGLGHELSDATKAMIDWCNEQGGINGRLVEGKYYDAKVLELGNAMLSACADDVFMLVGQGWVLDSAQEEARVGCGLGSVPGFAVSPEFAHGPFMMSSVPNPADFTPAQHLAAFARAFPQEIKRTAAAYAQFPATLDTYEKVKSAAGAFGYEFVDCDQVYGVNGEDDWRPLVQKFADCDVDVVMFVGSPNPNFQNFLVAAQQLSFDPLYLLEANYYSAGFAEWNGQNGGAADKVYIRQAYFPFEEAADNPATQKYLDILEAAGGDIDQLGAQSAGAFLLWATGVKACGSDVTRDCVLDSIASLDEWTGGGLHVPTNPGSNMPPSCGLLVKMTGATFERFDPAEPGEYECDDSFVQPVTGEVVDRVALGPDRISTLHLPG